MPRSRQAPALAAAVFLAACSTFFPPSRTSSGPWGGPDATPSGDRGAGHRYQVSLDVRCDGCSVTYWFGPESVNRRAGDAGWHDVIYRTPLMRESVRLQARAAQAGNRSLRSVSIAVDGKVVAQDACDDMEWERVCVLTVETAIGPGGEL